MMKTKLIKTLLVAAIAIIAMGVTATETEKTAPEASPAAAKSSQYFKLKGRIGSYPITMFLLSEDEWKQGDFVGYYYYNSNPRSKFSLLLDHFEYISIHATEYIVLKEYIKSGKNTGVFSGVFEGEDFQGTFTNSKGKKFKFVLRYIG